MQEDLLTFAAAAGSAGVVLASLKQGSAVTEPLERLRSALALHGVLDAEHVAVRGGRPVYELSLVVLAPHYAAAVVAQPAGPGDGSAGHYEYALTHDRAVVAACARALAAHLRNEHR